MQRNTVQRCIVLNTVNYLQNHPTADAVYEEIFKSHPHISRATVYRNLNQLAHDGEISKIDIPSGAHCFDHRTVPHYHAKCFKCGHVIDVNMDYISNLEQSIHNSDGFTFSGHTIVFSGVCSDCKSSNQSQCEGNNS